MAGEPQFAAFLSYSRRDVRLASWLVRSLEEFRLPRQTVDDLKARQAPFLAARPVFRDEHDMPVGGVISDRLSEVLDASATMIVLCTAASAKSDWVNREIELFAGRHPNRRIIPAVAEGEPDSDASYPPALLKLGKPLAADLRNPAERRQSVIKIAAAVLGLDVDQLVGRVQKHRAEQRRLLAIAGGAAAAIVVGLGVTASITANNAKLANNRAYAQVEQLLTKTRADMDDLAAKRALHEAAKLYFDSKAGSRLSDRDLLLKAEWLRQEGEDAGKRGEDDKALAYRQEAFAATSDLLKRNPDNPEFLFSHSQSAYWLGYYYFERGRLAESREGLEAYQSASTRLLEVAPDYKNEALQTSAPLEANYSRVNLGMLALEENRDARHAAAQFLSAIKVIEPEVRTTADKLNLSRNHLQYVDALAQFAPAAEVVTAVQLWEPLLFELETYRRESDSVDFHLANSWGMIFGIEGHLPPQLRKQADPTQKEVVQKPKHDPDNVTSLSLAAEIDLKDAAPDCQSLSRPPEMDVASKPWLGLLAECLADLPVKEQISRCLAFAGAVDKQPGSLSLESSWAPLLSACSRSAARASNADLSAKVEETAERFFAFAPEQMRLQTQFALAGFQTAQPRAWIAELNSSLDRRGWVTKGEN